MSDPKKGPTKSFTDSVMSVRDLQPVMADAAATLRDLINSLDEDTAIPLSVLIERFPMAASRIRAVCKDMGASLTVRQGRAHRVVVVRPSVKKKIDGQWMAQIEELKKYKNDQS